MQQLIRLSGGHSPSSSSRSCSRSAPHSPRPSPRTSPGPRSTTISSPAQIDLAHASNHPETRVRSQAMDPRAAFDEAKALYTAGIDRCSPAASTSPRVGDRDDPEENRALGAIPHFLQASLVFASLPGASNAARSNKCLWQVGVCYGRVGWARKKGHDWTGASDAFKEALKYFRKIGDSEKEATTLYQLGTVSHDLVSSADSLKKAALIYADLGNEQLEAMCFAELAHLFGSSPNRHRVPLGGRDRARRSEGNDESIVTKPSRGEREGGDAQRSRRAVDVDRAIFHWKQALLLYLKMADLEKEARTLLEIGLLAASAAKVEMAYNHFLQARVVFRRLGRVFVGEDANTCYHLGKLCTAERSFEAAVRYFEEASTLFHEADRPIDEAWTQYRLGLVMLKIDSNDLALDYFQEARRLFAAIGSTGDVASRTRRRRREVGKGEASCLVRIAEILGDQRPEVARQCLEQALEQVETVASSSTRKGKETRIRNRTTLLLSHLDSRRPNPSTPITTTTTTTTTGGNVAGSSRFIEGFEEHDRSLGKIRRTVQLGCVIEEREDEEEDDDEGEGHEARIRGDDHRGVIQEAHDVGVENRSTTTTVQQDDRGAVDSKSRGSRGIREDDDDDEEDEDDFSRDRDVVEGEEGEEEGDRVGRRRTRGVDGAWWTNA